MDDAQTPDNDAPDCRCPVPIRPTGREPEQLAPWVCLTCGGFACEYADSGTRCPSWRCDCFIATHPDSPMDIHPEAFVVGRVIPPGSGAVGGARPGDQ